MDEGIERSLSGRIDEVCDAFEQVWKSNQRPSIVTFLKGFDGPQHAELLRELLLLDIDYRYRQGEDVNQADYETEIPEVTDIFTEVIEEIVNRDTRQERGKSNSPGAGSSVVRTPGESSQSSQTGHSAGRYEILKHHAAGGLGDVFIARDSELNREVALKEIKDKFANDENSRDRFVIEAEITGRLEHPGIVPVYGLGKYHDGRPYYAMRFIKGDTLRDAIRSYHKEKKHSVNKPLELRKLLNRFIDVCNAVEYAHSRGVIHRDLKPDNVMLGKFGEALVVDWGLAKQVGKKSKTKMPMPEGTLRISRVGDSTAETQQGDVVGTAQYMSPEQAAGQLDELAPASDVYSLGAVLFCLLTGQPPFDEAKSIGLLELLKSVRKGRFLKPCEIDSSAPKALEAICLKAMQTEPEDRYESAKLLADDVERYLADEPVEAHREPFFSRTARWGRNHKAIVASTTAAVITVMIASLILAGVVSGKNNELASTNTMVVQTNEKLTEKKSELDETIKNLTEANSALVIANNKERIALAEADRQKKLFEEEKEYAKGETRKAIKVKEVLLGMFEAADPLGLSQFGFRLQRGFGEELTASTLLKRTAEKVATDLANDEVLLAELQNTIGQVYRSLGMYPQAEKLLESAYKIRLKNEKNKLDLADSLYNLGWLHHDRGDYFKAEKAYLESLKLRKAELRETDPRIRDVLFSLGWLYSEMRKPADSEKLLIEGLSLCKKDSSNQVTLEKIRFQYALVGANIMQRKKAEAFVLINLAAAELEKLSNESPLLEAIKFAQQGFIAANFHGDYPTAFRNYEKSEKIGISVFGENHVYLAVLYYEMAKSYRDYEDLISAEKFYNKSLDIMRSQGVMTHPHVSTLVVNYARLLIKTRRREEGIDLVDKYLKTIEETSRIHQSSVFVYDTVARFYRQNRRYKESINNYRKSLGIYAAGSLKNSLNHARAMNNLAFALMNSGSKSPEIETLLRHSLKIKEDEKVVNSKSYAATATNLSRLLIERNEFSDEVETMLLQTYEFDRKDNNGMFSFSFKKEIDYDFSHTLELLNHFYIGRNNVEKAAHYVNLRKSLFPKDARILFQLGCEYSNIVGLLQKRVNPTNNEREDTKKYSKQAIKALKEAYNEGFLNRRLWKTDKDLDPVRNEEKFKKLLIQIEADYLVRRKKKSVKLPLIAPKPKKR